MTKELLQRMHWKRKKRTGFQANVLIHKGRESKEHRSIGYSDTVKMNMQLNAKEKKHNLRGIIIIKLKLMNTVNERK